MAVATDHETEFAAFVRTHDAVFRRYLSRKLPHNPSDVDDALQLALVRAWEDFASWPQDPERRMAFAQRILKRAAVEQLRARYGRRMQRVGKEELFDFRIIDDNDDQFDSLRQELLTLLGRMNASIDGDDDQQQLERRMAALNAVLPALKDIERQVLFAHHPAGANRSSTEVAAELGITHSQARQHYMEAREVLRPLIAHALAPGLDLEEAGRVFDYTSGVMTDKRERGRMKRHLAHCEACRALADNERIVIGAGARVVLPLPALVGLVKASGATAATGAGTAAIVASSSSASAGSAGGGILSGVAAKALAVIAAASIAAGGYATLTHAERGPHQPAVQTAAAAATPQPPLEATATPAAGTATPTSTPTHHKRKPERKHPAKRKHHAAPASSSAPAPTPTQGPAIAASTPAPPAPAPSATAPSTPGSSSSSGSTASVAPQAPADSANDNFSTEFTP